MKIFFKRCKLALIFVITLSLFLTSVNFDVKANNTNNEELKSKISSELSKEFETEKEFFDVMIYLKEQVDTKVAKLSANSFDTDEEAKSIKERKAVINELTYIATKTQDGILSYLYKEEEKGNVKSIKNFFIVNAINVVAKKDVIESLKYNEEIESITINKEIKTEKPIKVIRRQKREIKNDEIEWNIKKIGANKAWEEGASGTGVVVGIIDTAANMHHKALKRKFRGYDKESDTITYEGNYYDAIEHKKRPEREDDSDHGTHCMGIILGSEIDEDGLLINQIGVAPDAKFISARVFDDAGNSSAAAFLEAAQWMLAPNGKAKDAPSIINNSWGGGFNKDPWFRRAVKAWRDANILPIFASGNQHPGEPEPGAGSISAPASYLESLAVGAVDKNSKLAVFSKRGPSPFENVSGFKPELTAPGVAIRSSVKNSYEYLSGTSMAAPHVAGVAALIKSVDNSLSAGKIENIMIRTATKATDENYPNSPNHGYGYGIVNAHLAVAEAGSIGSATITGRVSSNERPVLAEIFIKESERSVFSDSMSGMYSLRHPAKEVTLVCRAYGYYTQEKVVNLSRNDNKNIDFELVEKPKIQLEARVLNSENEGIEGAYAYLLEDDNIKIEKTEEDGRFFARDIPTGTYTLRVFKEGYKLYEKRVELLEEDKSIEVILSEKDGERQSLEDTHDNAKMNPIADQNLPVGKGGFSGAAVRFVPKKEGASIESISIQFYGKTLGFSGDKARLSIKALDERGRTIDIFEGIDFSFVPGQLKTVSLEQYNLRTDKPFYAVVSPVNRFNLPFIVGMDSSGDPDYSYVYQGGNFLPIEKARVYGALMIKAAIEYPVDALDIVYNVDMPSLNPIYPEDKKIEGSALSNQNIQVVLGSDLRINTISDESGRFVINLTKTLRAGEEITAYAKNKDGIKSKPLRKIVLTNKSVLRKNISIANSFVQKDGESSAKDNLKALILEANNLIDEISTYERLENVDRLRIRAYQDSIDEIIIRIKNAMLELSPEKKPLKIKIDEARTLLDEVWLSASGKDVPQTKYFTRPADRNAFNNKILSALVTYNKSEASIEEIEKAIKNLDKAREQFLLRRRKGKKYLIKIDERYQDGRYEGEGRGKNLLASHIIIEIRDGRLVNIDISDWKESEISKREILKDAFIERIIENNALDINLTKGYERECEAIIKAITQAAEKALREGENLNTDKSLLLEKIERANELLNSYPVSRDGKDVNAGLKWVFERDRDDLKKAISDAMKEYEKDDLTIDLMNKAITLLTIAMKNFESSLQVGEIEAPNNISYKDGEYLEASFGYNRLRKNEFRIIIEAGKLKSVEIVNWQDSPNRINYINDARFIEKIIEKNSPDVDTVSGATLSSISIRDAVREALKKAGSSLEETINEALPLEDILRVELDRNIFMAKEMLYLNKNEIENILLDKNKLRQDFIFVIKEADISNKNPILTRDDIVNSLNKLKKKIKDFNKMYGGTQ